MEFRVLKSCNAVYLGLQGLPGCDENKGESHLWMQNMLANQPSPNVFGGIINIGRKPSCHVQLSDRSISGCHGTIRWTLEIVVKCATTATENCSGAPLNSGDIIKVSLSYTDSSSNGSFNKTEPIPKGTSIALLPSLLTVPNNPNSLDPCGSVQSVWSRIYLGRPQGDDSAVNPVFAFSTFIGLAECTTTQVLSAITPPILAALPTEPAKTTFIGCIKDPRLVRVKTELEVQPPPAAVEPKSLTRPSPVFESIQGQQGGTGADELRKQIEVLQQELIQTKQNAEKQRLEREREVREKLTKTADIDVDMRILNKKVQTLTSQTSALTAEKAELSTEVLRLQEALERSDMKLKQTQSHLEKAEQRIADMEAERYQLVLQSSTKDSKISTLESQCQELEMRLKDTEKRSNDYARSITAEKDLLVKNNSSLAAQLERVRQQAHSCVTEAQKAVAENDQIVKRQLRSLMKTEKEHRDKLVSALSNLINAPSAVPDVTALFAPPAQQMMPPTLADLPPIPDDDACSATDDDEPVGTTGGEDDEDEELCTIGVNSQTDTPIQMQENERPKRCNTMSDDSSKRRRRSDSVSEAREDLLVPNSQFS